MNECPTRERTGTPPCSRTISGTAREVIRLWITVLARVLGQRPDRDQRGDRRRGHRPAALVHHEAAVGVAVEGEPDVGADLDHLGLQVAQVGRVERVGLVVGEAAVELEVQRDDGQRRRPSTAGTVCPAIPLPASTTTVSGRIPDRSTSPRRYAAYAGSRSRCSTVPRRAAGGEVLLGQRPDLPQPGVLADRRGAGPAQLDPVVAGRVVARGEHRPGQVERAGRRSRAGRSSRGRRPARRRPGPVAPSANAAASGALDSRMSCAVTIRSRAGHPGEGRADRARDLLVQLVGDDPADVVRLDDGGQVPHPADRTGRRSDRASPLRLRHCGLGMTRRWPRRPVPESDRAPGSVPASTASVRRSGRAASRTASASASRSSLLGIGRL